MFYDKFINIQLLSHQLFSHIPKQSNCLGMSNNFGTLFINYGFVV